MPDTRIENLLRNALRAEADSVPLTISAAELELRLRLRRSQRANQRMLLGAAAALAVAVGVGAAVLANSRNQQSVATSPSPSAPVVAPQSQSRGPTVEPTAPVSPGPSLYADQSLGIQRWQFESPIVPDFSYQVTCQWYSSAQLGDVYTIGTQQLFGEDVSFDIAFGDQIEPSIYVGRDGHASYRPGPTTGSVELTEHAADWSSGTMAFTDLAPDPETAEPGPLPTPSDGWTKPIGGEPATAKLSGTVSWDCGSPPANLPSPEPVSSESPAPDTTPPPFPNPQLAVGDQSRRGEFGCGVTYEIDGSGGADACGPVQYQIVGANRTIRIRAGEMLTFRLPGSWTFVRWTVGWAPEADAEAYRGAQPDSFAVKAEDSTASGSTITVQAPPEGEWSVVLGWSGKDGSDTMNATSFYRVIVEP
jgi:hypothetical protein